MSPATVNSAVTSKARFPALHLPELPGMFVFVHTKCAQTQTCMRSPNGGGLGDGVRDNAALSR